MADRSVIQWDKDDLETLKLFKLDLLGLGALNVVHRSFDLIAQHYNQSYSLATVPPKDQALRHDLQRRHCGCLSNESQAQMSMSRLRFSAILRSGHRNQFGAAWLITGGMVILICEGEMARNL